MLRKKKDGQDKMVLKAYNGRCVQSWLTDCLVDALEIHPEHEILVLTSSCMILGVMDQCDHDTSQNPIIHIDYQNLSQCLLGRLMSNLCSFSTRSYSPGHGLIPTQSP